MGLFDFLRRRRKASEPPPSSLPPPETPPAEATYAAAASSEPSSSGSAAVALPSSATSSSFPTTSERIFVAPPSALLRLEVQTEPPIAEDEALACLRVLRQSPYEAAGIEALLARARQGAWTERAVVTAAAALVERGEPRRALAALEGARTTEGLLLRADVLEAMGEPAFALAVLERVLLREYDAPGARERHARLASQLGVAPRRAGPRGAETTLATTLPRAPFRIVRELGRGGAGVVFEAVDAAFGRTVALKVYHRPARDRDQLLHEARVAASLSGPGVVRAFDLDPEGGWIAFEHASGGSLKAALAARPSPVLPLAAWAPELARTLARVHRHGWVHHDVKPANVLFRVGPGGRLAPVLSDFGSARHQGEPPPAGSLGFVSPERLAGRATVARDDIYAFGRLLEEALHAPHDAGEREPWAALAARCTGPDDQRPEDGSALVALLPSVSPAPFPGAVTLAPTRASLY